MPKTTEPVPDKVRIELRLAPDLAANFNRVRGDIQAATYIRRLIEKDIAAKTPTPKRRK